MSRDEEPLSKSFDLSSWRATSPKKEFAAEVVARATAKRPPVPKKARLVGGIAVALAFAAGAFVYVRPKEQGEISAETRREVSVARRATLVLEPGAKVRWSGGEVTQERGDVFYRVEPGGRFVVHAPGKLDVEVKGTCFAVREDKMGKSREIGAGFGGAVLASAVLVTVYEGKVIASQGDRHLQVGAGESARATAEGVSLEPDRVSGPTDGSLSASNGLVEANGSLSAQVREYKNRLEALRVEKETLELRLKKLESTDAREAGARHPDASYYDHELTKEEWAELAKKGEIRYRTPCREKEGWTMPAEKVRALGLAPDDVKTIREAYVRSYQETWNVVRPLCKESLGLTDSSVDQMGPDICVRAVAQAWGGWAEATTQIAEIRAGLRADPGENAEKSVKLLRFLANAGSSFERDLAANLGPEEARRLYWSDDLCIRNGGWVGGVIRGH